MCGREAGPDRPCQLLSAVCLLPIMPSKFIFEISFFQSYDKATPMLYWLEDLPEGPRTTSFESAWVEKIVEDQHIRVSIDQSELSIPVRMFRDPNY